MSLEKPPKNNNPYLLNHNTLELFNSENIKKEITKSNEKYLYWDKVKYLKLENNIDNTLFWNILKFERTINSKSLNFGKYKFKYYITDKINKQLHELDMELGGTIQHVTNLSQQEKQIYILSSLQEEAIASSKMEGAATTRKVAKELLRKGERPTDIHQRMIVNNYETMQYLVTKEKDILTPELILTIHKKISKSTLNNDINEGKLRDQNDIRVVNSITEEIVHIPPNKEELVDLLNEICNFCNDENYFDFFIHPIIKAIILHFLIAYIHPFVDGNGRTARALVYWFLLKNNYWLTKYIAISRIIYSTKSKYEKSFLYTENDENDLTYFINYNMDSLVKAKEDLKNYLNKKIKEKREFNEFIQIDGISQRQALILKKFHKDIDCMITTKEIQSLFSVSNQTARNDLEHLAKLNYLKQIKLNNRKNGYILETNNKKASL